MQRPKVYHCYIDKQWGSLQKWSMCLFCLYWVLSSNYPTHVEELATLPAGTWLRTAHHQSPGGQSHWKGLQGKNGQSSISTTTLGKLVREGGSLSQVCGKHPEFNSLFFDNSPTRPPPRNACTHTYTCTHTYIYSVHKGELIHIGLLFFILFWVWQWKQQ